MNFQEEIRLHTAEVEDIICRYLPPVEGKQKTVMEAMRYAFEAGGKRLRPMLMLEMYRRFGGKTKEVEPFMAALEMIHTYSLIHDDLPAMDDDDYRRGRLTTHKVYGEAMGILAGDALLNFAFETALKALEEDPTNLRLAPALLILSQNAGIYGMLGGQVVDVESEGKPIGQEDLFFIASLKTGALLSAAMCIGAVLGGANKEQVLTVYQAAQDIGVAFQIQDDILDITGDAALLGKPIGSDAKNEKTTYATLCGVEQAAALVESYTNRAMDALATLPGENAFLDRLIVSLIRREK